MKRYYVYDRRADGSLHRAGTAVCAQDNGRQMVIIASDKLNDFFDVELGLDTGDPFVVNLLREVAVEGAGHPAALAPHVYLVERKTPSPA